MVSTPRCRPRAGLRVLLKTAPSATELRSAVAGAQFVSDFNGLTVGDLFERMRTTMPLNNPGALTRDQYADVLAFMLKANGYPAGERELYRRSEFLNTIRFEAAR
jgi:hypothetical protein